MSTPTPTPTHPRRPLAGSGDAPDPAERKLGADAHPAVNPPAPQAPGGPYGEVLRLTVVGEAELLGQARQQLATAIHDGAGLDAIGERIDHAPHTQDARDGLWLFAWATVQLEHRRGWVQGPGSP